MEDEKRNSSRKRASEWESGEVGSETCTVDWWTWIAEELAWGDSSSAGPAVVDGSECKPSERRHGVRFFDLDVDLDRLPRLCCMIQDVND